MKSFSPLPSPAALAGFPLLALLLCSCGGPADPPAGAALTGRVESGPLQAIVSASGEITAQDARRIRPGLRETATLEFVIPDGTRVKAGEVIARFNATDLGLKIDKATLEVEDEEVRLRDQESQVRVQELESSTQLMIASNEVAAARLNLGRFLESDSSRLSRQAELDVRTAETELARKKKRFADLEKLLKEGFITEDEVEEGRIALDQAEVKLETGRRELDAVGRFTVPVQGAEVSNKLSRAEMELEKNRATFATQLLTKRFQAASSRRALESKRTQLVDLKADLAKYEVRAPVDGVVQHGDTEDRWNREVLDVGSQIKPGQVIATMPDFSSLSAVLNVPEAEISRVAPDQPVRITVDALAGRAMRGKVRRVAEVATAQGFFSTGVKEFEVRIELEDYSGLRPGFSCRGEIVTDTVSEALHVPVQAVFKRGRDTVVYDPRGTPRTVKVGVTSPTRAQVTGDLKAGDEVLLTRPPGPANGKDP